MTSSLVLKAAIHYLKIYKSNSSTNSNIVVCKRKLLLAATIIAWCYVEDNTHTSADWARLSGLSTRCIESIVWEFLNTIDWKLQLSAADLDF